MEIAMKKRLLPGTIVFAFVGIVVMAIAFAAKSPVVQLGAVALLGLMALGWTTLFQRGRLWEFVPNGDMRDKDWIAKLLIGQLLMGFIGVAYAAAFMPESTPIAFFALFLDIALVSAILSHRKMI